MLFRTAKGASEGQRVALLTSLEAVDVLSVDARQQPFLMQETQEVVHIVGVELAGVQLLGQGVEGAGVLLEEVDVKYRLWVWDVVVTQVVVESSARRPAQHTAWVCDYVPIDPVLFGAVSYLRINTSAFTELISSAQHREQSFVLLMQGIPMHWR